MVVIWGEISTNPTMMAGRLVKVAYSLVDIVVGLVIRIICMLFWVILGHPTAKALYVVITGTILAYDRISYMLFDLGSALSYVSMNLFWATT